MLNSFLIGAITANTINVGGSSIVKGMKAGQVAGSCTPQGSSGSVSFGVTFSSTPYVTATIISASTTQAFSVNIHSITTTGFSYIKTVANGSGLGPATCESFNWFAIAV